jgi:DNA-binding CsgD family transcriptional regulator
MGTMTPELIEEAKKLAISGATYQQIAETLGVREDGLGRILGTTGIHRDIKRERHNTIYSMKSEGKPADEIAQAVGLTVQTVKGIIAKQRKYRDHSY